METVHLGKDSTKADIADLTRRLEAAVADGRAIAVTVADEDELLSPKQAGERLGFSRQHVRRLIDWGHLEARQVEGSSHWKIPLRSILDFEERRDQAAREAGEWSRRLTAAGAPLE